MSTEVFLRKSSGVIRAVSPLTGAFYGYLSAAGLYTLSLYFLAGAAIFPAANIYLANIILLIWCSITWIAYAMLSSAMPRSGGDYVFQSRLLRGDVGFALTFGGLAIWQTFFAYLAGNTIASGILPPIFEVIGYSLNNKALIDVGITLSDPWTATIVTIVIIWFSALILLRGMKVYAYLQNYFMIPASFVALAIMVGLFLVVPRETFVANFNSFQNMLAPNVDWYNTIISKAKELGYDPSPRFSWYDTLGYAALMYALYMWCMWSAELLGEIKGAEKIKNAWLMMSGATVLEFITCIIGIAWATDYMGSEFVKSLGYLASSHPEALALPGFTWRAAYGLFAIITLNLPPYLHIPIAILIALGFLGATFQIPFNCVIGASRLSLSMSFDRILPDWMGSVNKRGAPDKFIYFHQVIASILAIVLTAYPGLFGITSAGWLAQIVAIVATLIAAIVFPYSAKKLFSESPAGKYRYAGIPAITLAGIAGLIMNLWIAGYYLAEPGLGIVGASIESKIFVVGIFVACFVWFYIAREWRKRQGINIAYAFREVPPA